MFGFGKKKLVIASPVSGKIMDITEVKDEVFSAKMMGDGFAVEPEDEVITAPCDGKIVLLPKTRHAVALEKDGVQLLIHVGLDTVELDGKGFEALVAQGDVVEAGTPLLQFNRSYIESQQKPLTTMLVLTNMAEKVKSVEKQLDKPEAVLKLEVK